MNLNISRDALLKPIQQVIGVVERRHTLPVLGNLLLQIRDGYLHVTGNDLEVELVASTPVPDAEDSEVTVPARKLLEICKALPEGSNVQLRTDGHRVVLRNEASKFTLSTLPVEDYPTAEEVPAIREFSLSQGMLRCLIERSHFCMAHQDVRYFLNGLLLELDDRIVRTVATDGHRLALCEVDTDVPAESAEQVIVPRKGVSELLRLLEDSDAPVECRLGSNAIQLKLGNVRATSKLVDGRFPNYDRVIPAPGKNLLVVETRTLREALVRAAILSNEKYKGVRFELKPGDELQPGELLVVANNPEQEEAAEKLAVDYEGDPIEIGFNVTYVIDALNALDSEMAQLYFHDGDSSCLIREDDNSRCRYVVMPMRL